MKYKVFDKELSLIIDERLKENAKIILNNLPDYFYKVLIFLFLNSYYSSSIESTDKNASCGTSTLPTIFILFLPSFCFSNSFLFLDTSPP